MNDEYKVENIPMPEIFSDAEFNCRGSIAPIDVIDLAKSIKHLGLQNPISIQPYTIPSNPVIKYRIVAGHRRHMAYRVNKEETIPAMVKYGMDEMKARIFNLTENLKRQELNILQEARAILPFVKAGWPEEMIVNEIGTSRGWVQVRKLLLMLPEQIQKEAAAGMLTQAHIRQLASMKNPDDQFAAVRLIKDRKDRGEKVDIIVKKPVKPFEKKVRLEHEMVALQEYIQEQVGNSILTILLGWTSGCVNNFEIHRALYEHFRDEGVDYKIPK